MRFLVAVILLLSSACNSAPTNSCATGISVVSSGEHVSTCAGVCVDAGALGPFCAVDCTDGGVCSSGTECASVEHLGSSKSFCLPTCAALAAEDAACPSPLACNDAGVCAP